MASAIRFNAHLQTALDMASRVADFFGVDVSRPVPTPLTWLKPLVASQIGSTGLNYLNNDSDDAGDNNSNNKPLVDSQISSTGLNDLDSDCDDVGDDDSNDDSGGSSLPEPNFSGDDITDSLGTLLNDFLEEDDGCSSEKTTSLPPLNLKWEAPVRDRLVTLLHMFTVVISH